MFDKQYGPNIQVIDKVVRKLCKLHNRKNSLTSLKI